MCVGGGGVKKSFLTKQMINIWNFCKPPFYPLDIQFFSKIIVLHLNDSEISVNVNVHPVSPPTLFLVITNLSGTRVLAHVLKKREEKTRRNVTHVYIDIYQTGVYQNFANTFIR